MKSGRAKLTYLNIMKRMRQFDSCQFTHEQCRLARGMSSFKGLLFGSVSTKVTHYAACPVLVVR
ncbi:universal stress protein [Desulfococcaceae bacterium HSG9]|nr:universal stress protein [Desulfococcaceae bacterium HSG9]